MYIYIYSQIFFFFFEREINLFKYWEEIELLQIVVEKDGKRGSEAAIWCAAKFAGRGQYIKSPWWRRSSVKRLEAESRAYKTLIF